MIESNSSVATLVLHHSTHGLSTCPELVSPKDAVALQCSKLLMSDLQSALQPVLSECRLTERAGSRAMPASAASLRGTLAHFLGKAKFYTWHWLSAIWRCNPSKRLSARAMAATQACRARVTSMLSRTGTRRISISYVTDIKTVTPPPYYRRHATHMPQENQIELTEWPR